MAQSIVDFWELPNNTYNNSGWGLTTDSTSLYISSGSSSASDAGTIYQYDFNGNQIGSIDTGLGRSQGLAWDGSHFWYFFRGTSTTSGFYKITPTGTIVDTILSGTSFIGGCHWDGSGLWYSLYFPDTEAGYYKLDVTTGTVVDTILTFHLQPHGITSDDQFIYWSGDDFSNDDKGLFIYDPLVGDTIGSIPLIDPIQQNPRGVAWDGTHLWVMADPFGSANRALFKFDLSSGGTPNIDLPFTEVDFGLTAVGSTASRSFFISNVGTADLIIDSLGFGGSAIFATTATFPATIPAGSGLNFEITFTPPTLGNYLATMTVHSNDPFDPLLSATLSGEGLNSAPTITLSATNHVYQDVWVPGGNTSWTLEISNRGLQTLEVTDFQFDSPYFFIQDPLPLTIAPDDTAGMRIWFRPDDGIAFDGRVIISSNDPVNSQVTVFLNGHGELGPFALGAEFWEYQVPDNPNTTFNEYRPLAMKAIDDVTGDGGPDVIIASRNYWTMCLNGTGANFTEDIWRFNTLISSFSAGAIGSTNDLPPQQRALAIADDLNNDGYQDVVIGTGGGNERVYAINGFDGSELWSFGTDHPDSFGLGDITSVEAETDFNNDGVADVVACGSASDNTSGRRSVYVFDGTNGNILGEVFIGSFLRMVVSSEDLNGNGTPDVVVTTGDGVARVDGVAAVDPLGSISERYIWHYSIGRTDGGGRDLIRYDIDGQTPDFVAGAFFDRVVRIDGDTGAEIWNTDFGFSGVNQVKVINDLDGDGLQEVLVASFLSNFYCLSGADGTQIWEKPVGDFSWSAEVIPDISGDGLQDIILAARTDQLFVLDGTNGNTLYVRNMNSGTLQGATLAGVLPDVDGNGSVEILGAADDGQIVMISGGVDAMTAIDDDATDLPKAFALAQNYPNPFNPQTDIRYQISDIGFVELVVYDVLGRQVKNLVKERKQPGSYTVSWDGRNSEGIAVGSGIYFYRLTAGEFSTTRKMMLIR